MKKEMIKYYVDKYGGLLIFFPVIVPLIFIAKLWIKIGGRLYEEFLELN